MAKAWVAKGEGEPVLFVQGAGVPGKGWTPQLDGLSDRFHCAAFDNRGIDGAKVAPFTIDDMRRDALEVMDALGWKSAHIVGHSVGGLVAQARSSSRRRRNTTPHRDWARSRSPRW